MSTSALNPSIFDVSGLAGLKSQAGQNDPKAIRAAAQQFEALFLQMVLKSMREATPREGLFDSDQSRLYESLLDQQLAQVMASRGSTGLAALIERQLQRDAAVDGLPPPQAGPAAPPALLPPSAPTSPAAAAAATPGATAQARDFIQRIWPDAVAASRTTGIPAAFLVAQAALETGWGRSEPKLANGQPSHNLFGIKAGNGWTGAVAEATTTEYADGVPRQRVERFRAYGSQAEAFQDHARLLAGNPRYAAVLGVTDAATFANRLQDAGYATDPAYASKLSRILAGPALQNAAAA